MDRPPHLSVAEILAQEKRPYLGLTSSLLAFYAILAPACLVCAATNGYDGSVLTGLQGVDEWNNQFGTPAGALLGITSASYPLGAIISTPFSALISDRFGRRWSIVVGSVIMLLGVLMQCLSSTIGVFIGGRIIVGFGVTIALAAAPVLVSELAHPRHRVLFTSLSNTSYYLGSLTAGWVTFGSIGIGNSWSWRLPVLLQGVPAAIQMIFVLLLDESPRWLCYKDRTDEAFQILVRRHGGGNPEDPLVQAEYYEMHETLKAEKQAESIGFGVFLTTPANRKRLAILVSLGIFGQWSGNGLVSYYLTRILGSIGITSQEEQTSLNGTIATVNYVTTLAAAVLSTRLGRRIMFIGGAAAMWVFFSALTASIAVYNSTGSNAASRSALGFIFLYYTAYNVCLNPLLFLYPTEILPYRLRAVGLSILLLTTKAGGFFNQFVNPVGMDSLGWRYYLVYVVWLLVELAVFYFLYPETKGLTLETAQLAFGEDNVAVAKLENKDHKPGDDINVERAEYVMEKKGETNV